MAAGRVCWLHPEGDEHVAAVPVGVAKEYGDVIPADKACARRHVAQDFLDPEQVVDASTINVGWVRA